MVPFELISASFLKLKAPEAFLQSSSAGGLLLNKQNTVFQNASCFFISLAKILNLKYLQPRKCQNGYQVEISPYTRNGNLNSEKYQ